MENKYPMDSSDYWKNFYKDDGFVNKRNSGRFVDSNNELAFKFEFIMYMILTQSSADVILGCINGDVPKKKSEYRLFDGKIIQINIEGKWQNFILMEAWSLNMFKERDTLLSNEQIARINITLGEYLVYQLSKEA